ncbi:single-stranded DNA-binding protein [Streptacidiphilus sp. PAMC 29251]
MSATITLNGRLTADPDMRFTPSGMAVAKFTIVTSRRTKNEQTGEWADADTTFWDCTAFKTLAENAAESLAKGMEVVAVGRAVQENWQDKETGAKRSKIAVKLDSIGPNLARASAKVSRAQPNNPAQQNGAPQQSAQQGNGGGWGQQAPPQQAQQGGWGNTPQQQGGFPDAPPF